jgi:hypothetical protein
MSWRSPSRSLVEAAHGQRRSVKRSGAAESAVRVEVLPITAAPLIDQVRVRNYRWGKMAAASFVPRPPPLLFIAQRDRGPPTIDGLDAPITAWDQGLIGL